jgi:hypothetical protein
MTQELRDDRSPGERWAGSWRSPHSVTTLMPCMPADENRLHTTIREREAAILHDLAECADLHALRVVVVPRSREAGPRLLVNSVSDAGYLVHLRVIAQVLFLHLREVLPGAIASPTDLARHIQQYRVSENTLFLAASGYTVSSIRQEARLREVLRDWLASQRAASMMDDAALDAMRRAAAAHVQGLQDPGCASGPAAPPAGLWRRRLDFAVTFLFFPLVGVLGKDIMLAVGRIRNRARRALTYLVTGLWWLYAGPFTIVALLGVRLLEWIEPEVTPPRASSEKLHALESVEDRRTKNELTEWFPVKPSWLGRAMMWLVLFGAERGARHCWTDGRLAGAQNIHFARLVLVDGGRTMVFMSDYEGSFDAYMNHFIGVGGHSRAVIPISSRAWGSPKTRWLYLPRDPVAYPRLWQEFARRNQLPAAVRYVAYPTLSANDILNNRIVRNGLFADRLDADELADWARRI